MRWMRRPGRLARPAGAADGDVDARRAGGPDLPQRRGRRVAQHRAGPGGEHRGHAAPVDREHGVPHGVDAAVDAVQAPRLRARRHRVAREARAPRAAARATTPCCRSASVSDEFCPHVLGQNSSFTFHAPRLAGKSRACDPRVRDDSAQPQHQPCTVGCAPKRREIAADGGDRGVAAVGESRSHWSASAQRTSRRRPLGDHASERSVPVVVNTGRRGTQRRGRDEDARGRRRCAAPARSGRRAAPTPPRRPGRRAAGARARTRLPVTSRTTTRRAPRARRRWPSADHASARHRADARGRAPDERAGVDVADLDAPARADPGQRVRRARAPRRRHRPARAGRGRAPRSRRRRRPRARRRGGRRSGSRRATRSRRAPARARRSSTPRARSAPPRSARARARRRRRARAATTSPPSTARAAAASRRRARSTSRAPRRRAAAPPAATPSDDRDVRSASRTASPRAWRTHRGGSRRHRDRRRDEHSTRAPAPTPSLADSAAPRGGARDGRRPAAPRRAPRRPTASGSGARSRRSRSATLTAPPPPAARRARAAAAS